MTTPTSSSAVQLQIQNIFGVRSKLDSCLYFADEHTIIYPAGNQFILANVETKSQRIFRCNELERIDCIIAHSGAAVIAVVATSLGGDKQSITISFYDLHASVGKRKRMFELREGTTKIQSMAFSNDAKYLAVLDGVTREYTLTLWMWQKSRAVATVKLGAAEGVSSLSQILFSPIDNNYLSIIGSGYFRFIRHIEGNLRLQPSSAKLDQHEFISHAWYDSNRIVAGTNRGHVCVLFNGDIQTEFDVIEGQDRQTMTVPRTTSMTSSVFKSNFHGTGLQQQYQEHFDTARSTGEEVTSIHIVNKGFFCLVGGQRLCLYSKIGDSWDFAKAREYIIPNSDIFSTSSSITGLSSSRITTDRSQIHGSNAHTMWKVAVSSREEHVVILTSKQQIYAVSDITRDQPNEKKDKSNEDKDSLNEDNDQLKKKIEPFQLELVFNSYHQSSIRDIDIAVQKPLFITIGDDHTLRLWNYETNTIEQMRFNVESVFAVSIHPSGHQLVVAFSSKVSLMNILINEFVTVKDYPIHAAHEVKFSNGGHLFAAIDSNIIQIISPVFLKVVYRLNHGQTVKKILWKTNDLQLCSQSSNYFVIWNIVNQTKLFELKPTFRLDGGFLIDRDDKTIYLASDDGYIRAILNGTVINEINLPQDDKPSCLSMFPSNGSILCGTNRGSIYVIKTPLTRGTTGIFHYLAHSSKITQISVAFHESLIISACEDGVLILWGTHVKNGIKSEDWTPVILQNKKQFLDLSREISVLQHEVEDLKRDFEYRALQRETTYLNDVQRHTDNSADERKHHELQIERLFMEKDKQKQDFEARYLDLIEKFQADRQRIEDEDRERHNREAFKEEELIRLSQKMMEDNEFRLRTTIEGSENEIRDIAEFFTGKIRETENELIAVRLKGRQMLLDNEIVKKNIEADLDDEQLKVQLDFENEKKQLTENNSNLQKQFKETLELRVNQLTAKHAEQEASSRNYKKRIDENSLRVRGMTEEIVSLNSDIHERSQTIREKINRINDLELKNQELEKFKYVLTYKIEELERLIKPRTDEIERMKNQLIEMASEREKKESEISKLRFHNTNDARKVHAINKLIEEERQRRKECDYELKRMKTDLLEYFSDLTDPKRVRHAVTHLNEKYIENDSMKTIYQADETSEGLSEEAIARARQRKFLERTTSGLKAKLNNDIHITKSKRMKIMNENSVLLQELNSLREELKIVRGKIQDYEVAKDTFDQRGVHSIDALIQTLNSDAGNYTNRQRDNELIKEAQKNQQKIHELRQYLTKLQSGYSLSNESSAETENISILKLA